MEQKEEKDRFSVDMTPGHHKALADLAKEYKVTQGEVVECMLEARAYALAVDSGCATDHVTVLDKLLKGKRAEKVAAREQSRALYRQFKEQQKVAMP